jgi:hypothetical protein
MDLVGHALILVLMVVALVDPRRDADVPTVAAGRLTAIPMGLAAALAVFASAYWGSHAAIYDQGANLIVRAESDLSDTSQEPWPGRDDEIASSSFVQTD